MVSIITLLVVVTVSLVVNRIATVALTFTGLSRDTARFQARSAFSGAGFTTSESELIVQHPVRRKIIMLLMFFGNVGLVTVIATLLGSLVGLERGSRNEYVQGVVPIRLVSQDGGAVTDFVVEFGAQPAPASDEVRLSDYLFGTSGSQRLMFRVEVMVLGLLLLWMISASKWVDERMFKIISWALARYTSLDTRDYHGLLRLSEGFTVSELPVDQDNLGYGEESSRFAAAG